MKKFFGVSSKVFFACVAIAAFFSCEYVPDSEVSDQNATELAAVTPSAAAVKAYNWIVSVGYSNGLYNSQTGLSNVCYTYDQAVAVYAFIAQNDMTRAYNLLKKLKSLQNSSGFWYTAYNKSSKVAESEKWLGPVAWTVMAAGYYKKVTGSTEFDAMAKKALNWCLTCSNSDGSLYTKSSEGKYTSTEENQDAYAALKAFGYNTQAAKVLNYLKTKVWKSSENRWLVGPDDTTAFLDVNPWGVQSLGSQGPVNYLKALDYNMNKMRLKKTLNSITVDGFDFNGDKDDVWLEGTAQMAAAFYTAGRATDGDYFVNEIIKFQKSNGGITYSMAGGSTGDGWNMPKTEALSSTGWFIIAVNKINPFACY